MVYLQQSLTNDNAFAVCGPAKATHFNGDGTIRPIAELSSPVANTEEPLLLPKLFAEAQDGIEPDEPTDNADGAEAPLLLPKLNFAKPKKGKGKKSGSGKFPEPVVSACAGGEPLLMPKLQF